MGATIAADPVVCPDVLLISPSHGQGDLSGRNQLCEALLADLGDDAAMCETRVKLEVV